MRASFSRWVGQELGAGPLGEGLTPSPKGRAMSVLHYAQRFMLTSSSSMESVTVTIRVLAW